MKAIAISNHKGGCSKTTVALNIAVALAASGFNVLAVDLDFQGNLSAGFGADLEELERGRKTAHRFMLDDRGDYSDYTQQVRKRLDLLPACLDADAETLLDGRPISKELLLRERLKPARSRYDYCVIDSPPSLRAPTLNALAMSDLTIIPVESGIFALVGLNQLLHTVALIRHMHKPEMLVMALSTMYTGRQNLDKAVRKKIVDKFTEDFVFATTIPRAVAIGEATAERRAVMESAPESAGAFAFRGLAKEILEALGDEQEKTRANRRESR